MKKLKLKLSVFLVFLAMIGSLQPVSGEVSSVCEGTIVRWNNAIDIATGTETTAFIQFTVDEISTTGSEVLGTYDYDSDGDGTNDVSAANTVLSSEKVPIDKLCLDSNVPLDSSLKQILFISTASDFTILKDGLKTKDGLSGWTYEDLTSRIIKLSWSSGDNYNGQKYYIKITYDTNYLLDKVEEEYKVITTGNEKIDTWKWEIATIIYGDSCKAFQAGGSGDSSGDSSGSSSGGSALGPEIFQNPAIIAYIGAIFVGFLVLKKRKQFTD